MATILVDYENVYPTDGLRGTQYLTRNDVLYLFYSQCCGQIKAKYMEDIKKSGCCFQIYKLAKSGKNALDFYIASECGALSEKGEKEIAIISRDKGLSAVSDFIREKTGNSEIVIVRAPDIEEGLEKINAFNNAERSKILKDKNKMLDLGQEYVKYCEYYAFREKIITAFQGTEYETMIDKVIELVEGKKEMCKKELYTGSLHKFGKNAGRTIYGVLKGVI